MIITERFTINGREFIRTYSDAGMKILQNETGIVYDEAIDVEGSGYSYTETDEPLEEVSPVG